MVTVMPTNLQKIEFDVTTAEGPSRITIVSGTLPVSAGAFSSSTNFESQNFNVSALVDPTLPPGQFRFHDRLHPVHQVRQTSPAGGDNFDAFGGATGHSDRGRVCAGL
jgi:hypothetical protein